MRGCPCSILVSRNSNQVNGTQRLCECGLFKEQLAERKIHPSVVDVDLAKRKWVIVVVSAIYTISMTLCLPSKIFLRGLPHPFFFVNMALEMP